MLKQGTARTDHKGVFRYYQILSKYKLFALLLILLYNILKYLINTYMKNKKIIYIGVGLVTAALAGSLIFGQPSSLLVAINILIILIFIIMLSVPQWLI